jgi:hypothetical protein
MKIIITATKVVVHTFENDKNNHENDYRYVTATKVVVRTFENDDNKNENDYISNESICSYL